MTYRRVQQIGLLGIGLVVMWSAGVVAHTAGMRILGGTQIHVSSVRCQFEATGAGRDATTGVCEVSEVAEAILFCLNPSDHQIRGEAGTLLVTFGSGIGFGVNQKKGRTKYVAVARANGTASSSAECDQEPACASLREHCVNPNWVPFEVVPLSMTVNVKTFACLSSTACPCSPAGENGLPVCLDHNTSTGIIDPEAVQELSCSLPVHPDDFTLGDIVQYTCTVLP